MISIREDDRLINELEEFDAYKVQTSILEAIKQNKIDGEDNLTYDAEVVHYELDNDGDEVEFIVKPSEWVDKETFDRWSTLNKIQIDSEIDSLK